MLLDVQSAPGFPRCAYAFYATSDVYAVAVMVFVRLLRRVGVRDDIDLAVLHAVVSPRLVAFAGAIATLPDHLVRLNSEWEDTTRAGFERHEADAHPLFYDTWQTWRRTRDELFAGRPLDRLTSRLAAMHPW